MTIPAALRDLIARTERKRPAFRPSRGGHAPGHVRERFVDLVELYVREPWIADQDIDRLHKLTGTLWNCTDTIPWNLRADVERLQDDYGKVPSTYGQSARIVRAHMNEAEQARLRDQMEASTFGPWPKLTKPRYRVRAISRPMAA